MGRAEQRERERKRSAKSLDSFFLSKNGKWQKTVPKVQRLSLCQKAKLLTPMVVYNCPMTIIVYIMSIKGHGMLTKGHIMSLKLQVK